MTRVMGNAPARDWTVDGHRLTLLPDGPERLEALIRLIDGATVSLRILYYIFEGDAAGIRVRDALVAAGRRGVRVSLLVDGFGSSDAPGDFFDPLEDSDGTICRYEPRFGRRYLLRNHQKLALADDARVIIGGFNVGDDYFGTIESGGWRDLGLLVEGDGAEGGAVGRLADYFDALLEWTQRAKPKMIDLRRILTDRSENAGKLQWLFGGPTRHLSPWAQSVCRDMRGARRMSMIAAYFGPNPAMLRRIGDVARRGAAHLLTAAKSDNGATIGAARFTYNGLLRRGVDIHEYQATKLHSKLVVIEDVVHIGSANFDMRSMYLNLELMLRVDDPDFADGMRAFFAGELERSEAITPALHHKRATLWTRIVWAASRFIVATMDYNVSRRLNFGLSGR